MEIREVNVSDAESVLAFMNRLDHETNLMLLEPGERRTTLAQQTSILASFVDAKSKVMFVISKGTEILGFATGIGHTANRNKHSMYCVMGIQASVIGQGFGKKLFGTLESWAKQNGFTRLELTVMCHNERAKGLYTSCGFEVEGTKRRSLVVDGQYVDEFYMAKLLSE